jgi:hypothetical protein
MSFDFSILASEFEFAITLREDLEVATSEAIVGVTSPSVVIVYRGLFF